jgi:hypothetical protein
MMTLWLGNSVPLISATVMDAGMGPALKEPFRLTLMLTGPASCRR